MSDQKQFDSPAQEALKKISEEKLLETMKPYNDLVLENFDRIKALVELYVSLQSSAEFSSNLALDEILRVSVVFTHATLEDFLRTMAAKLLPESDEQVLNQIPLLGLNTSGRAEKFSLGQLVRFKGESVDDVIAQSVQEHLKRSSYNNIDDITALLKSLGIVVSQVNQSFPKLAELMERRHLIVHRADRSEPIGSNKPDVKDIDGLAVTEWLGAVVQFIIDITPQIATRHLVSGGGIEKTGGQSKSGSKNA